MYMSTHFKGKEGVTHGIGLFYLTPAICEMLAWGRRMWCRDHPIVLEGTNPTFLS